LAATSQNTKPLAILSISRLDLQRRKWSSRRRLCMERSGRSGKDAASAMAADAVIRSISWTRAIQQIPISRAALRGLRLSSQDHRCPSGVETLTGSGVPTT
ncbi:unnamed protein product, partial [Symbiodinium pilosum]